MSGAQTVTGVAGATLLVLNFWTGDSRKAIVAGLKNADGPTNDTLPAARHELAKLGAATLFVGAATMLAGLSRQWGLIMATALVGLLLVWSINHYAQPGATPAHRTAGRAGATSGGKLG